MARPVHSYSGRRPCVDICVSLRFSEVLVAHRALEGTALSTSGSRLNPAIAVLPVWPSARELGGMLAERLVPESLLPAGASDKAMYEAARAPDYLAFHEYYWPFTVWWPQEAEEFVVYGTVDFEEAGSQVLRNLEAPYSTPTALAEPILSFMQNVTSLLEASRGERWGLQFWRSGGAANRPVKTDGDSAARS